MRTQNDGLPWNNIPSYGFLYVCGLAFALLGLLHMVSDRRMLRAFHARWFILLWLLTATLMAGMMAVNTNRINLLFIPLIYFAALGIMFFRSHRLILMAILVVYIFSFVGFTHKYFTTYPEYAARSGGFYASIVDAIHYAAQERPTGIICVTEHVNQPYIFVLFATKMDPRMYLQTRRTNNPQVPAHNVLSMDRYVFGLSQCMDHHIVAYVLHEGEVPAFQNDAYTLTHFRHYSVALPRNAVRY